MRNIITRVLLFMWVATFLILIPSLAQEMFSVNYSTEKNIAVTETPTTSSSNNYVMPDAADIVRILQDNRIVYAVGDTTEGFFISEERWATEFGILIANTQESLYELSEEEPIDVLIVEESALTFIDRSWVANELAKGTLIGLINIYYPEIRELTGFPCGTPSKSWYPGNFFILLSIYTSAENSNDVELIRETLRQCGNIESVKNADFLSVQISELNDNLDVENGDVYFLSHIASQLVSKNEFYNSQPR